MKNKNSKNIRDKKIIFAIGYYKNYKIAHNYYKNTAVYIVDKNKLLVFVAGTHILNLNYRNRRVYLDFLENIFKMIKPNLTLFECPKDISKTELRLKLINPKRYWSEIEYAITFSDMFNSDFRGMDLGTKKQDNIFLINNRKRDAKLFLFSEFLKFYYSIINNNRYKNRKKLWKYKYTIDLLEFLIFEKKSNLYKIRYDILKIHKYLKKSKNLEDTINCILQEATNIYVKKDINAKSLINFNNPNLYIGRERKNHSYPNYKINKLFKKWFILRDKQMIKSCIEGLDSNKIVIAIAGASHIQEIKERLNSALLDKFDNVELMDLNKFLEKSKKK